ncbi:protein HEADING DATE 3B isoform X2 [Diospyros lotus]|nr:protein HEADING DATE 3B isoform X2 [Diospyros lotus]
MYSSFCNSPDASNFAERFHSYPSGGMNLNATSMHVDWQPMEPTNGQALKAAGNFSLTANFSFPQVHCTSNSKNSSAKKFGEEDNFRVLAFVQSGSTLNFSNGQHDMEKEKTTTSSPNRHLQTGNVKQLKQTSITDLMPKQHGKNQTEGDSKMFPSCQDHSRWPIPILTSNNKFLLDSSSSPLARDRISGLERGGVVSLSEEKRRSLIDNSSRLRDLHQGYRALQEKIALTGDVLDRDGLSCTQTSHGDNHGSPNATEMVNGCHEDQCGSLLVRQADRNADISDTSIVDSISHVEISPDDVVGVIGQKQFWRARRAISHQQRVFAGQVFELHRLIKVQRLFAASPELLLKSKLFLGKPSIAASPMKKKLQPDKVPEAPHFIGKLGDDPQKCNPDTNCLAENASAKPHLPSLNSDTNKIIDSQQPYYKTYLPNAPPESAATESRPAPWCFQPAPGNQWLVPVMSPSEGLVYKPCTGPCPPAAGFMAPIYGSCGPVNLSQAGGDFLNMAYGIPGSHQQGIGILPSNPPLGQTYFPPYGMPLMNHPVVSTGTVDRMNPFATSRQNGQANRFAEDMDVSIPSYQNSVNMSTQKSGANSYCAGNLHASKESELQASTASSGSERVHADALPLFPTAPIAHDSDQPEGARSAEQLTRVIRVVPHNPRSASESAARIFRSIQEERTQHD